MVEDRFCHYDHFEYEYDPFEYEYRCTEYK